MFVRLVKHWLRPRTFLRKPARVQLLLEQLEDRCVPARFDYVGAGGIQSSGWSVPSNWTVDGAMNVNNLLPSNVDDVWFTSAGLTQQCTLTVPSGTNVQSLNLETDFIALSLEGPTNTTNVDMHAGTITSDVLVGPGGILNVTGAFDWYNGLLSGAATTDMLGGEMRLLDLAGGHQLSGGHQLAIENGARVSDYSLNGIQWSAGDRSPSNPSVANHGTWNIFNQGGLHGPPAPGSNASLGFSNFGTIHVAPGPDGDSYPDAIFERIDFTNFNVLDVAEGMLRLDDITGTGTTNPNPSSITIGPNGALTFGKLSTFTQNGVTQGTGELTFADGASVRFLASSHESVGEFGFGQGAELMK
jgi:hypothetical protein